MVIPSSTASPPPPTPFRTTESQPTVPPVVLKLNSAHPPGKLHTY